MQPQAAFLYLLPFSFNMLEEMKERTATKGDNRIHPLTNTKANKLITKAYVLLFDTMRSQSSALLAEANGFFKRHA